MKTLATLPLLACLSFPCRAEELAAPLPDDPTRTTIHRLPNGLTVYLSPNRQEPRVTAWIAVRAGSKNDPADSTGIAHYLEHMLFKGSTSLGTVDYAREQPHLDRIAALYESLFTEKDAEERRRLYAEIDRENVAAAAYAAPNEVAKAARRLGFTGVNAFTANEQTVYICSFPRNRAEAWAKLEAERFARPVFRLFQSELEAVYEEKNRSLDNADRAFDEALDRAVYKAHPYGRTTLGSIEHLKNPSLAKMYAFHRKHYVPDNMAIILAGDFEREEMLSLVARHFGVWTSTPAPDAENWPLPAPRGTERVELTYEAEEKAAVAWPAAARSHPDADALVVADMLLDSPAGMLSLDLVQTQKVKAASTILDVKNDSGDWVLWAAPKKDQTLEDAEALLLAEAEKLREGRFSEEDLRAALVNHSVHEKERMESNEGRAWAMMHAFIGYEPWPRAAGRLERLARVTKEQVVAAARKYLGPDRVVVYRRNGKSEAPRIKKPEFTKIALDESRRSAFFDDLVATPAKPIEPRWLVAGRDYKVSELPQGRLYAVPNPANDLFALTFHFELGRRQSRRLCAAVDLLNLAGAGALPAEEFKKRLYGLGTTLSVGCAEQRVTVSLAGLDESLPASLALLREHFEAPNVATGTLAGLIEVQKGARRDSKRHPASVHNALGELAKRGPDSEVLDQLTDAELESLDEAELKGLIRGLFDYSRRTSYVGNRSADEVAKLLADGRKSWKKTPPLKPLRYVRAAKGRVLFAHREMVQAQVGVFAPDETYDPKRSVDYQFLTQYLGGGMSAVVFQEIREARSLAYTAWGGYGPGQRKGDENALLGMLGCQADKTREAVELLETLLRRPPLTETRFSETAKAVEETYRGSPIPFRQAAGALMLWEDLGLKGDPRPQRFKKVLGYKLADLKTFSTRFRERPMTAWILGDRSRLDLAAFAPLGSVEEKKLEEIFPY